MEVVRQRGNAFTLLERTEGDFKASKRTPGLMSTFPVPPPLPRPPIFQAQPGTHLLCLEAMLQLKPQLVGLGLRQACGPEAGSGLHTERGVARPLPHGVEAWILHGSVAALGHLCLRCILLWEHGGLLLQQDVGILTWELLWIHRLALRRKPPDNKQINETTENCRANRRLSPLTALYLRLLLLHDYTKDFYLDSTCPPRKCLCSRDPVT